MPHAIVNVKRLNDLTILSYKNVHVYNTLADAQRC